MFDQSSLMDTQSVSYYHIYGTNHPQLKRSTRVTRVSHACNTKSSRVRHAYDTHTADTKTRMEILLACTRV